jgi:hypothetical protein
MPAILGRVRSFVAGVWLRPTAIAALSGELVVIANPRCERPAAGDDEIVTQTAWRRRHLWRADIGLFWFEGANPHPMDC